MSNCQFCDERDGKLPAVGGTIYENEYVRVRHWLDDDVSTYLGSLLVTTKQHTPTLADLSVDEARALGEAIGRVSHALKACAGAERVYMVKYGEVTPHVHIFLTARYPNLPEQYWRAKIEDWPDAPRGGAAEVTALSERLRSYLIEAE